MKPKTCGMDADGRQREKSKPEEYDTATREAFFQKVKDGCFMPGRRRKRDSKESGEETKSDVKNTGDSDSNLADDEIEDGKKAKRNLEPPPSPKEIFPGKFYNGMSKVMDMYQDPRGPLRVMNPDPTSGDEADEDKCSNGQAKDSSLGNDSKGSPAPRPKNDAEGRTTSKADANGSPTPSPKSDAKGYSATGQENNPKEESHTLTPVSAAKASPTSAESLDNSVCNDRIVETERLTKASPASAETLDNGVRDDRAIQTEWLAKASRPASAEPLVNDVRDARVIQTEWLRHQRRLDYREQEIRRAEHIRIMKERDPMYEYPNWPVVDNHDHQSTQYANIHNAPPTLGNYSANGVNPVGMAPNGQGLCATPPSLRPGIQGKFSSGILFRPQAILTMPHCAGRTR